MGDHACRFNGDCGAQVIGQPSNFSPDLACDVVEQLIDSDEVERALLLLDNMPAFYRDHPTPRMREIRESLHKVLWTPIQYKGIYAGTERSDPDLSWCMRYQLVEDEVRQSPQPIHIMELAPGAFTLPQGLLKHGLNDQFSYQSLALDDAPILTFWSMVPRVNCKTLFCAFEIIEHLSNEWEIYQNYLKFNRKADVIMLSTPLYTYGGGMSKWRTRELGHLRTYTPVEFHAVAAQMFKGYSWECKTDDTIVLTGRR